MPATEYIVFEQANDAERVAMAWTELGKVTASSADQAIRDTAVTHGDGTYAATPARGWQPRTVKVAAKASFDKTGGQS